jgi:YD repeat-containing protein
MKANYDPKTDTLSFILKEGVTVAESDEGNPGVILDYDDQGNLVSMEILDASKRVTEARKMDFQVA